MDEATRATLAAWSNFYVILGSASGALIGLMFVAITLVAAVQHPRPQKALSAFGTPTIVQLAAPMVLAALASAPWRAISQFASALELIGCVGVVYTAYVMWLARAQTGYKTELSDWLWFHVAPLVGYTALPISALELRAHLLSGLFCVAAVTLGLMLIAIRNAWDTATYVAVHRGEM